MSGRRPVGPRGQRWRTPLIAHAAPLALGVLLGLLLSRALLVKWPAVPNFADSLAEESGGSGVPPWARFRRSLPQTSSQLRHKLLVSQLSKPPESRFTGEQVGRILWAAHYVRATPFKAFFRQSWRDGVPHLIGTAGCLLDTGAKWSTVVAGILHNSGMSTKPHPSADAACEQTRELDGAFGEEVRFLLWRYINLHANGPAPSLLEAYKQDLSRGGGVFDAIDREIMRLTLCDDLEEYAMGEAWWSRNWKGRTAGQLALLPEIAGLLGEPRLQEMALEAVEDVGAMFDSGNAHEWSGRFPEVHATVEEMIAATANWTREAGTYLPHMSLAISEMMEKYDGAAILREWGAWLQQVTRACPTVAVA